MMALILAGAMSLLLVAAAMWLFARAQTRAGDEALEERIGQTSAGDFVDELAGMRHLQRIRNPLTRVVCHQFWGAGIDMKPGTANLMILGFIVLVVLLALINLLVGLALGIAVLGVSVLVLRQRVQARRRQIADQLPDFLEYVLRSLTAGNTLDEAMQSAALESVEPCRSLFLSVSRQVRLGASMEATLSEAAAVHQLRALHILALAARVNRRFGGSMRRVIKSLIGAIRRQEAASRELKAMTGETRFSAYVVAAIPILISGIMFLVNPGYYEPMIASGGGRIAMGVGVALQVLGLVIIWRMMASLRDGGL
ncbi:unnamed protein product [Chrysoparadoxa australica]